jgi:integrase
VELLFQQIASIKHRAILMTAYGAGLRISEACSLQTSDIDSKRMLIHVHEGKRAKDRYVMLSERLLEVLRTYWKVVRPSGPVLFPGAIPGRSITPSAVQRVLHQAPFVIGSDPDADDVFRSSVPPEFSWRTRGFCGSRRTSFRSSMS